MTQNVSLEIKSVADEFIALANKMMDERSSADVNTALMYASARFSSFLVANMAEDLDSFMKEGETGLAYFTNDFRRMFVENLADYEPKFVEAAKYAHLTAKGKEEGES